LPSVEVRCPSLSNEQAAEVEARALAELMTNGAFVIHAELECAFNRVTVAVSSESTSVVQTAALQHSDVRDTLIDTLCTALLRVRYPDPPPASRPSTTAFAPVEDAPPPTPNGASSTDLVTAPHPPPVIASLARAPRTAPSDRREPVGETEPPPRRSARTADISAGAILEWWQAQTAAGAVLEAGYGAREISFAMRLGALTTLSSAEAFDALELSAAASVRWQPEWAYGFVLSSSLGASWLDVTPQEPYEPRGETAVSAGFASIELGRPAWLGPWVLVPSAGLRLFAAERSVRLDGHEELVIGHVAPDVGLRFGRGFE
jgi:hypothetical protein